ncbi:MAG: AsmA family protein [Alphaproteobacteria bacterium]
MKKFIKIFFITTLAVLFIAIGAGWYFLSNLDVNKYKSDIAKIVKDATGRELVISGNIELKISLNPTLVISGVKFANADFAKNKDMVKTERIEAKLSLLPLLSKKISVAKFIIIRPEIYLEKDASGNAGWDMAAKKEDGASSSADQKTEDDGAEKIEENKEISKNSNPLPVDVDIKKFLIQDGLVLYSDAQTNQEYKLNINHFALKAESLNSPLELDFEVVFDGKQVKGSGTLGQISSLLSGGDNPYPIDLIFTAGGLNLGVNGSVIDPLKKANFDAKINIAVPEVKSVADFAGVNAGLPEKIGSLNLAVKASGAVEPLSAGVDSLNVAFKGVKDLDVNISGKVQDVIALKGADIKVDAKSEKLGDFLNLFVKDLSKVGKLDLSIQVKDRGSKINIENLKLTAGASDLAGKVMLDKDFKNIVVDLTSQKIDLTEFVSAGTTEATAKGGKDEKQEVAKTEQATDNKSDRVIPDIKIPFEAFQGRNVNLTYNIASLVLPEGQNLKKVAIKTGLNNGSFRINAIKADIGEGSFETSLLFNASSGTIADLRFKASGRSVLIPDVYVGNDTFKVSEGGKTDLEINLTGRGDGLRSILASLKGTVLVVLEETRMSSSFLNWFTKDITSELLGLLGSSSTKDALLAKCSVIRLDIKDGVAKTEKGIVLESDAANFVLSGSIGLGDETLDISFMPQAKKGVRIGVAQAFTKLIKIKGTFANPKTALDAMNTAKTAVTVGAALATGGLSALGQAVAGTVTEDEDLCYNALKGTVFSKKFTPTAKESSSNSSGINETINKTIEKVPEQAKEIINDLTKGFGNLLNKIK